MRFLDAARARLRLLTGRKAESRMDEEFQFHIEMETERFIRDAGLTRREARRRALVAFGGVEKYKEELRSERGLAWLTGMSLDFKLGARMFVKSPGLSIVAVIALAVAIGAGAGYLEVINDLYRPQLPFPDGDRIVGIRNWDAGTPDDRAVPNFLAWRQSARSLTDISAFRPFYRNVITSNGESEPARGAAITSSGLRVTSVQPALGRLFTEAEEAPGAEPVVLIGHDLWSKRFASSRSVLGQYVWLGKQRYRVVGVMPEGYGFPINHAFWIPLVIDGASTQAPIKIFGRLADGVGPDAAQSELRSINGSTGSNHVPRIEPYVSSLLSDPEDAIERKILYSFNLFFVLLLCLCGANVATLVFARTATREGEITLRNALGATRARIAGQLFVEAFVLTLTAGVTGLVVASLALGGVEKVIRGVGGSIPFWWNATIGPATLFYTLLLITLAAAIVGLVPAIKATTPRLQSRLRQAAVGGFTPKFGRVWTGVIIGQVAITVLFLCALVSLGWNFRTGRYGAASMSFDTGNYIVARVEHDDSAFSGDLTTLEQQLRRERWIRSVAFTDRVPGSDYPNMAIEIAGGPPVPPGEQGHWVRDAAVTTNFLETLDVPLVSGRPFTSSDAGRNVVIVDQSFVTNVLKGADPIGLRIRQRWNADEPELGPWLEIVGVVEAITASGSQAQRKVVYRPTAAREMEPVVATIRVTDDVGNIPARLRAAATAVDPSLRLTNIRTLTEVTEAGRRVFALFFRLGIAITAVALLLATAGVYSLMAFTVSQRTREIGIRAALGAAPRRIVTSIFSRAFKQLAAGVVVGGVPGVLLLVSGAPEVAAGAGILPGVARFLAVAGLMLLIGILACVTPARRALRIQPTEAVKAAT